MTTPPSSPVTTILLVCDGCDRKPLTVKRQDFDPPDAVDVHSAECDKCGRGGTFDMTSYYGADGTEILADPATFKRAGS